MQCGLLVTTNAVPYMSGITNVLMLSRVLYFPPAYPDVFFFRNPEGLKFRVYNFDSFVPTFVQNVLLTRTLPRQAKLCDFGLSRVRLESATMTGNVGTPQWTAPEVLNDSKYRLSADIYR